MFSHVQYESKSLRKKLHFVNIFVSITFTNCKKITFCKYFLFQSLLQIVNKNSQQCDDFILLFKGIDNDGPNPNVEQLRYCSSSLTKVGYGTLRPPVDDSYSPNRGAKVLEKDNADNLSFQEYCRLNSCTDEGLDSIAAYNKFSDEC